MISDDDDYDYYLIDGDDVGNGVVGMEEEEDNKSIVLLFSRFS